MENEVLFSNDFTERQIEVISHVMMHIGASTDDMHILKSQEYYSDTFPIDAVVFEPTQDCDFYTISTVGLSSYYFPKHCPRSELILTVSKNWQNKRFDPHVNPWPIWLLLDIAYGIVDNRCGTFPGQVFVPDVEENYKRFTNKIAGIVTMAEDFPFGIYDTKIGDTYTKFFQLVLLDKDEVAKVDDIGAPDFIKYDLHDSDGTQHFMLQYEEKKLTGLEKVIKQNEDTLKGN